MATEQLGLRLPPEIVAFLRRRGREDERSMAYIVVQAVRAAMAEEARREAQPEEARPMKKAAKPKPKTAARTAEMA